ncbi:MAG TPA: DUF5302 domain-containing protein [Trebonia sp.]|nr:DUF5302 domain-containing protein [Trebonia sp.]
MSDSAQDDAPATAQDLAQAAEVAEAAEAAEPGDSDAQPGELDDVKRKFREALDRKKQASAKDSAAASARAAGKAHAAGGPATSRRQFRRKSG